MNGAGWSLQTARYASIARSNSVVLPDLPLGECGEPPLNLIEPGGARRTAAGGATTRESWPSGFSRHGRVNDRQEPGLPPGAITFPVATFSAANSDVVPCRR